MYYAFYTSLFIYIIKGLVHAENLHAFNTRGAPIMSTINLQHKFGFLHLCHLLDVGKFNSMYVDIGGDSLTFCQDKMLNTQGSDGYYITLNG